MSVGVNADPSLHFGKMPRNSNLTKWIRVSVADRSEVELSVEGNISRLMEFDRRQFVTGEERVPVHMTPVRLGYHTGTVTMKVQRPRNRVGRQYLNLKARLERFV